MRCLNIEVPPALFERWLAWFAPEVQPFLVAGGGSLGRTPAMPKEPWSAEVRDTFGLYGARADAAIGLDEQEFMGLPRSVRSSLVQAQVRHGREVVPSVKAWASVLGAVVREQAGGRRFVWWRSMLTGHEEPILRGYDEASALPSRHDEVCPAIWEAAEQVVPAARSLAGTFAWSSGPNCFGTVMAAAGVPGLELVWMLREPFERWLAEATRPGGDDSEAGTVLVWRSTEGHVQHAAVTLGGRWALQKPSQGWMTPRQVRAVEDLIRSVRRIGQRLERHTLRQRPLRQGVLLRRGCPRTRPP